MQSKTEQTQINIPEKESLEPPEQKVKSKDKDINSQNSFLQEQNDEPPLMDFSYALRVYDYNIADVKQDELRTKVTYAMPSPKQFAENNPRLANDEEAFNTMYSIIEDKWRLYKDGDFSQWSTEDIYVPDNKYGDYLKRKTGQNYPSFIQYDDPKPVSQTSRRFPGIGTVEIATADEVADKTPFIKDKEGRVLPVDYENLETQYFNDFKRVQNLEKGIDFFWQEAKDGERIAGDKIRSALGPRHLESSWYKAIPRGLWSGTAPMMVRGSGQFIEVIGDLIDPSDQDKWSDRVGTNSLNWANKYSKQNYDEMEGAFNNWSSFRYQVMNGIGQISSTVLLNYATGGMFSSLGLSTQLSGKIAKHFGMSFMAAEAAGAFREEAKNLGIGEFDSALLFPLIMAATYASERVIPADWEHQGFSRYTKRNLRKTINNEFKEYAKTTGIPITSIGKNGKETLIKRSLNKWKEGFKNWGPKSGVSRSFLGAFDESLEEIGEGYMHSGIKDLYNLYADAEASETLNRYNESSWKESDNPDKMIEILSDGSEVEIPKKEYEAIQKDIELSTKIKNKEGGMFDDTSVNFEEGAIAGISSLLTGLPINLMQQRKEDNSENKFIELALALENGDIKDKDLDAAIKEAKKDGVLGSKVATENGDVVNVKGTTKDGQPAETQANQSKRIVRESIGVFRDIIKRYGINSAEVLKATMGDKSVIKEATKIARKLDEAKKALEALEVDPSIFTEEDSQKYNSVEEKTKKLEADVERYSKKFADATQPKEGGKYSKTYSSLYFESAQVFYGAEKKLKKKILDKDFDGKKYENLTLEERDKYKKKLNKQRKDLVETQRPQILQDIYQFQALRSASGEEVHKQTQALFDEVAENYLKEEERVLKSTQDRFDKSILSDEKRESVDKAITDLEKQVGEIANYKEGSEVSLSEKFESTKKSYRKIQNFIADVEIGALHGDAKAQQWLGELEGMRAQSEAAVDQALGNLNDMFGEVNEANKVDPELLDADREVASGNTELFNRLRNKRGKSIENLTVEEQLEVLNQIIEKHPVFLDEKKEDPSTLESVFRKYKEMMDNKVAVMNPASMEKHLEQIKAVLTTLRNQFEMNVELMQNDIEANENTAEHSPLRDKPYQRIDQGTRPVLNKEESISEGESNYTQIIEKIDNYLNTVKDVKEYVAQTKSSRDSYKVKAKSLHLGARVFALNGFMEIDSKLNIKELDDIEKVLNEHNVKTINELLYLFSKSKKEKQEEIQGAITKIERLIVQAETFLEGKMDNVLKELAEGATTFTALKDFVYGSAISPNENSGLLSESNLEVGKKDFNSENKNTDLGELYQYIMISKALQINRFGGKDFSKEDLYAIYRDMLSEKEQKGSDEFVPNYEQEQALMEIVSFLFDPKFDSFKNFLSEDEHDTMIRNGLYVRGFAGTGKTTIVLKNSIQLLSKLKGRGVKVTIVSPNHNLQSNIDKDLQDVSEIETSNNILLSEFLEGKASIDPDSDIVIFDEISVITRDQSNIIKDKLNNSQIPSLFLGDDNQVSDLSYTDDQGAVLTPKMPIMEKTQRTIPMTEVYRSGVSDLHYIQDYYRNLRTTASEGDRTDLPITSFSGEGASMKGVRYMETTQEIEEAFMDYMKNNPNAPVTEVMLIVKNKAERDEFLRKHPEYENHVRTVEFIIGNEENAISGIASRHVFFATNPVVTSTPNGIVTESRIGLTGVSRASESLVMIGKVSKSKKTDKVPESESINTEEISEIRQEEIRRLHEITSKKAPGNKTDNEDNEIDSKSDFRSINLTEDGKNQVIVESEEKINELKNKGVSALKDLNSEDPTLTHITESLFEKTGNENANTRSRNSMVKAALLYNFNSSETNEKAFRERIQEYFEATETKYTEDELFSILSNSLFASKEILDILDEDLTLVNLPFVSGDKIAMPAIVKIVGYSNGQPVVDVYDFRITSGKSITKLSEYDKKKLAAYADILRANGLKINNLKISNIVETFEKKGDSVSLEYFYGKTLKLDSEEAISLMSFENENEANETFVGQEEFFENERSLTENKGFKLGQLIQDKDSLIFHKLHGITSKRIEGKIVTQYHIETENGNIKAVNQSEFESQYQVPNTEDPVTRFKTTAEDFENGVDTNTTNTFFVTDAEAVKILGENSSSVPVEDFYNPDKNVVYARKMLLVKYFYPGVRVTKEYRDGGKVFGMKNGQMSRFEYDGKIAINRMSEKDIDKALDLFNSYGEEITKQEFIDQGLDIVSADFEPEFNFGAVDKTNTEGKVRSIQPKAYNTYMEETDDSKAEALLDKMFENAFDNDDNLATREALIEMNKERMRRLRSEEKVESVVNSVEPGKIIRVFDDFIPIKNLIDKLVKKRQVIEAKDQDNMYVISESKRQKNGKWRNTITIKLDGVGELTFLIDRKIVKNNKDLDYFLQDLSEVEDLIKAYEENFKDLSNKEKADLFKEVEESVLFRFVKTNANILNNYKDQLPLRFNDKGVSIKGSTPLQKIKSLKSIAKFISSAIANNSIDQYFRYPAKNKSGKIDIAHFESIVHDVTQPNLNLEFNRISKSAPKEQETKKHEPVKPESISSLDLSSRTSLTIDDINNNSVEDIVSAFETIGATIDEFEAEILSEAKKGDADMNEILEALNQKLSDDEEYPKLVSTENKLSFVSLEKARETLRSIIGDLTDTNVFFHNGYLYTKDGQRALGLTRDALIKLAMLDGKTSSQTVRHEAMHFIINNMVKPGQRKKILETARKEMEDNGEKINSESDIHEYISKLYENSENIKFKNLLQRFIMWLKKVANQFGAYHYTFDEILYLADQGYFKDRHALSSNENTFYKVENEHNSEESIKYLESRIGDVQLVDWVKNNIFIPEFIEQSPFGRGLNENKTVGEALLALYNKYDSIDEKTREKLSRVLDRDGSLNFEKIKRMFNTPLGRKYLKRDIYPVLLSDKKIFASMTQIALGRVNLNALVDFKRKKALDSESVSGASGQKLVEAESFDPNLSRSEFQKMLLQSIPIYDEGKKAKVEYNGNIVYYANPNTMDHILIDAANRLKQMGKRHFTDQEFFDMLEKMKNETDKSKYKTLIYSFMSTFGNKKFADSEGNADLNFRMQNNGYQALAEDEQVSLEKRKRYRDIVSGFISYYSSLGNVSLALVNLTEKQSWEVKSSADDKVMKAYIRESMKTHFIGQGGFLNKDVSEVFDSANQKNLSVTKEGIFFNGKLYIKGDIKKQSPMAISIILNNLKLNKKGIFTQRIIEELNKEVIGQSSEKGNKNWSMSLGQYLHAITAGLQARVLVDKEYTKHFDNGGKARDLKFSKETKAALDLAKSLYQKASIQWDSVEQNTNRTSERSGVPDLPSPADFYMYYEYIGNLMKQYNADIGTRMIVNSEGNFEYSHPLSSNLYDAAMGGSRSLIAHVSDLSKKDYVSNLPRKIKNENIDPVSPIIGNNGYNNPILANVISVDPIQKFDGIKTFLRSGGIDKMTDKDFAKVIIEELTYKQIIKGGNESVLPSLYGTLADKKNRSVFNVVSERNPIFFKSFAEGYDFLEELGVNYTGLANSIDLFVNYYEKTNNLALGRWNNVLGKNFKSTESLQKYIEEGLSAAETKVIINQLTEKKDYFEKFNPETRTIKITGLGNSIITEDSNIIYKPSFIAEWRKTNTIKDLIKRGRKQQELLEKATLESRQQFAEWIADSGYKMTSKMTDLFKQFGYNMESGEQISDMIEKHIEELREKEKKRKEIGYKIGERKKIEAEIDKLRGTEKKEALKEAEENLEQFDQQFKNLNEMYGTLKKEIKAIQQKHTKESRKIRKQIIENKYQSEGNQIHPLIDIAFWNFHVLNESMDQIVRGSQTNYANLTDFIKRGSSLTGPGTHVDTSRKDGVGKTANTLILRDIPGLQKQFSEKFEEELHTDGLSIVNPIWAEMLKRSAGQEFGNVHNGMLKPMIFDYNPVTDDLIYAKLSQMPINNRQFRNNKIFKQMFEMMVGEELMPYFMEEYENNGQDIRKASTALIDRAANDTDIRKLIDDQMVGYILFESAVKSGKRKIIDFDVPIGEMLTLQNVSINKSLNNEKNRIKINNDAYKIQTVTKQDVIEAEKVIPTQILSVIGGLDNETNETIVKEVNHGLAGTANIIREKLVSMSSGKSIEYMKELLHYTAMKRGDTGKAGRVSAWASPDVSRNKAIAAFLTAVNKYIKPNMAGQSFVQAPDLGNMYFDKDGNAYLPSDLDLDDDSQNVDGKVRRPLKPILFIVEGKETKTDGTLFTKEELIEAQKAGKKVEIKPAEVIAPFGYMKVFGITRNTTLRDVMSVVINGKEVKFDNANPEYKDVQNKVNKAFEGMELDGILDSFHPDIRTEIIRRFTQSIRVNDKYDLLDTIQESNPKLYKEIDKQLKTLDEEGIPGEGSKAFGLMMNVISNYYYNLNKALNVFGVRIPTTNASSGWVGRIVAFDYESENTVYTSAEKNILDGSDYDIDQVSMYFLSLDEWGNEITPDSVIKERMKAEKKAHKETGKLKEKAEDPNSIDEIDADYSKAEKFDTKYNGNMIFTALQKFYRESGNIEMILEEINLDSFRDKADLVPQEWQEFVSDISSNMKASEINLSGQKLVGHFQNLEKFTLKLLAIPKATRDQILPPEKFKMFSGNKAISEQIAFVAKLINAATDNAKEGGLLGRLNITESTSPIVNGMVMAGLSEKEILDILQNETILNASKKSMTSKSITGYNDNGVPENAQYKIIPIWEAISEYISGDYFDTPTHQIKDEKDRFLVQIREYAYMGEQLRRFGNITNIQQEISIENSKRNNVINSINEAIGTTDADEYIQRRLAGESTTGIMNIPTDGHESNIRKQFNIGDAMMENEMLYTHVRTLAQVQKTINESITTDKVINKAKGTIEKRLGQSINIPVVYETIERGIEDYIVGQFIADNFKEVTVGDQAYDLSLAKNRVRFSMDFPLFIEEYTFNWYKNAPKGKKNNTFLRRVKQRSTKSGYLYLDFSSSNDVNDTHKKLYRDHFEIIDESVKNAFRAYQLLMNGFRYKNGSMIDFTDEKAERQYTNWIQSFDPEKINENDLAEQVILRNKELVHYAADTEKLMKKLKKNDIITSLIYYTPKKASFNPHIYKFDIKKGTKEYLNSPYPTLINTYSAKSETTNLPVIDALSSKEMRTFKNNDSVIIKSYFPIVVWHQKNNDYPYSLSNKDQAVLQDGTVGNVEIVGPKHKKDNLTNTSIIKFTKANKPQASRISKNQSKASYYVLKSFMDKLQKAFPNIRINYVNNITSKHPELIGYFENGQVFFNTDKLQLDTPIHEITHVFIDILESANHELYRALENEAITLIESNHEVVQEILKEYADISKVDLVKEVIATMAGWNSQEAVRNLLDKTPGMNSDQKASTLYGKISALVNRFYTWLKNAVYGALGVQQINSRTLKDFDFKNATIKSFAEMMVNAVNNGQVLSYVSSKQMSNIAKADVYASKIKTIYDVKKMAKVLTNPSDRFDFEEMSTDAKVDYVYNLIDTNTGKIGAGLTGTEYNFKGMTVDEIKSTIRKKVITEYETRDNKFKAKISNWINEHEASVHDSIETFGKTSNDIPIYKVPILKKFKKQIEYASFKEFGRVSELEKMEGGEEIAKHLSKSIRSFDPHISIEKTSDGSIYVSLYDITMDNIDRPDIENELGNIASRFLTDREAKKMGLSMTNNPGDVRQLMLVLMANKLMNANPNIKIKEAGVISLKPSGSQMKMIDFLKVNKNISVLSQIDDFINSLSPELKELFKQELKIPKVDYEKLLNNFYENAADNSFPKYIKMLFQNPENYTVIQKKNLLMARLRYALENNDETNNYRQEINLLTQTLLDLKTVNVVDTEMNSEDMSLLSDIDKFIQPGQYIANDIIQALREITLDTSNKIVEEVQEFQSEFKPIQKWFESRNSGISIGFGDKSHRFFKDLFVKRDIDGSGNEVFTGEIFWTTDETKDPVNAKKAKELGLSAELLEQGEKLVNMITDQYIDLVYHYHEMQGYMKNLKTGKPNYNFTKKDAYESLMQNSSYQKGMLPLMTKTSEQLFNEGELGKSSKKRLSQITNNMNMFDDANDLSKTDVKEINKLSDQFFNQIGYMREGSNTKFGSHARTFDILGIGKNSKGEIVLDSQEKNNNITTDIETIMNYFAMSSKRKIHYENDVLPIINGAKVFMTDMKNHKDKNLSNEIDYVEMFTEMSIRGQRRNLGGDIGGVELQPTISTLSTVGGTIALFGNVNVGVVSSLINGMHSFVEGIANQFVERGIFNFSDLIKANRLIFSEWGKMSELCKMYQNISMSEWELISHPQNMSKTKKGQILSRYWGHMFNYASDYYGRNLVMIAQMVHDGTWDAHEFDSETGKINYNRKKDKRFYDENGQMTEDGNVLYETIRNQVYKDGFKGQKKEGELVRAYTRKESRKFKNISDMFVVGAYTDKEKVMLTHYTLGRFFAVFRNYLFTHVQNAVMKGHYIGDVGRYKVKKDAHGKPMAEWERLYMEGWVRTATRMIGDVVKTRSLDNFKNMSESEKYNWLRIASKTLMVLGVSMLYNMSVKDDDDDKTGFVPDWRILRNIKYSYAGVFALFDSGIISSPFAIISVFKRILTNPIGEFEVENIQRFAPGYTTIETLYEPIKNEE